MFGLVQRHWIIRLTCLQLPICDFVRGPIDDGYLSFGGDIGINKRLKACNLEGFRMRIELRHIIQFLAAIGFNYSDTTSLVSAVSDIYLLLGGIVTNVVCIFSDFDRVQQ